jgi:diguanylate cyclase (GGDEF)-like protein
MTSDTFYSFPDKSIPGNDSAVGFQELMRCFFDNVQEALFWVHRNRVVKVNQAAGVLFARDLDQLIHLPLEKIIEIPVGSPLSDGRYRCILSENEGFDAEVKVISTPRLKTEFLLRIKGLRNSAENQPGYRTFEKMLVDLFGLVSIVRDKEHLFRRCLALLGEAFLIERACLAYVESPIQNAPVLYQWKKPGFEGSSRSAVDYINDFSLWTNRLEENGHLTLTEIGPHSPNPLALELFNAGIHSLLAAAIFVQNEFAGFIVLEGLTPHRPWSKEDISILKTSARILSAFLDTLYVEKTLKDSQKQLYQAQKMEALGTLVAGVAHEVNNPMNLILYNIDILKKIWKDVLPLLNKPGMFEANQKFGGLDRNFVVENLPRLLADADKAAERVVNIVSELKRFARHGDAFEKRRVQLNEAVAGALRLCEVTLKKANVRITQHLDPELPAIVGNIQSLEQIIVNLVINGAESMTGAHGKMVISTEWIRDSDQVRLQVSDTGSGVDPRVSGRLFDPFVTTKQDTGGTGLGLSVTYNLVEAHNGSIGYGPNPAGKGTAFTVLFPIHAEYALAPEPVDGIDALTGCFSQAYINKRLPLEIKRAARYRHGLGLILCDIHRNRPGEMFSNGGSDLSMLKEFAVHINRQIRSEVDWVARTDSGRFLIALPETDLSGAVRLADRLHEEFTNKPFSNRQGNYRIEARFGVIGVNFRKAKLDIQAATLFSMLESCLEKTLQEGRFPVETCVFETA